MSSVDKLTVEFDVAYLSFLNTFPIIIVSTYLMIEIFFN